MCLTPISKLPNLLKTLYFVSLSTKHALYNIIILLRLLLQNRNVYSKTSKDLITSIYFAGKKEWPKNMLSLFMILAQNWPQLQ